MTKETTEKQHLWILLACFRLLKNSLNTQPVGLNKTPNIRTFAALGPHMHHLRGKVQEVVSFQLTLFMMVQRTQAKLEAFSECLQQQTSANPIKPDPVRSSSCSPRGPEAWEKDGRC